jgi:hypothetical protein
MRRPPRSRINLPCQNLDRRPTGGAGKPPCPFHTKKGLDFPRATDSSVGRSTGAARILPFTSSPPPIRPASIRTLEWSLLLRCRLGSSIIEIGCLHLRAELNVPVSSDARSTAASQSPELGDAQNQCSRMANFRATAATARFLAFFPPRDASSCPHRFKSVSGPRSRM